MMEKEIKKNNPIDTDPDPSPKAGARRLRHYWTRGKGAAKIRWGVSGDFNRCVRHLGKYVTDPKGLCNVYHVAAVGAPPGQGHPGGKSFMSDELKETLIYAESLKQLDMSKNLIELFDIIDEEETKDNMENLEHKQLTDESPAVGLTEVKDDGVVEALVSVTGIVDNVNDIIVPGAYEKTLKERTPKGVWSHDWNTPVSKVLDIKELMPGDENLPKTLANGQPWPKEAGALYVKAQFNLGTQRGREAFSDVEFYKDQAEWSIGYNVPKGKAEKNAKGTRLIKELNLFEYSPVLFGAASNARSLVSAAKSLFDSDEEFLNEIKDIVGGGGVDTVKPENEPEDPENPNMGETYENPQTDSNFVKPVEGATTTDTVKPVPSQESVDNEARVADVAVSLTAESIRQINELHSQLGSILAAISKPAAKPEPAFEGEKTLRGAMDALINGSFDSGIIQAIDDNVTDLENAIKTMDQSAIQDNANDALDEITFALQDPKTDEQTAEELKALVAAIGEALKGLDEVTPLDKPGVPVTAETVVDEKPASKSVQMSADEWKSFLSDID